MIVRLPIGISLALILSSVALAQDATLPIRDASTVREVPATPTEPRPVPGLPSAAPPASSASPEAAQLRQRVQAVEQRLASGSGAAIKPPPPVIEARAGVNEIIPIGVGALNRLRTNFSRPQIKTVSDAMVQAEGGVIYAASNTEDPITLFVHEYQRPEQALSLTLLPRSIPPIDIAVNLEGHEAIAIADVPEVAEKWEAGQPYVETLNDVMVALAGGTVPSGYGLETLKHPMHPLMPHCRFGQGVIVTPRQVLTGRNLLVLVSKVSNRSTWPIALDESQCMTDGVRAVAAWPRVSLASGQDTELFIVVQRPEEGRDQRHRPAVIGDGHDDVL
jgi:conjugal transfer pilus assembly protein TraK